VTAEDIDSMLRKPTQSGLADWAFIGLLVALGVALAGNLLVTGLETYMASGYDWYAAHCPEDRRARLRFEELLFPRQGGIKMVGPDGQLASGNDWAVTRTVPIATEVAACFPDRLVGDKLLLPEDVNPLIVQEAILAAFDVSQGDRAASLARPAGSYPMNTPAAPCVLAATTRVHRQSLASVPPPSPRCRGLLWRHVRHWLLVGWTPMLVFVTLLLLARRRARRARGSN
jgi:hypothetical protein